MRPVGSWKNISISVVRFIIAITVHPSARLLVMSSMSASTGAAPLICAVSSFLSKINTRVSTAPSSLHPESKRGNGGPRKRDHSAQLDGVAKPV